MLRHLACCLRTSTTAFIHIRVRLAPPFGNGRLTRPAALAVASFVAANTAAGARCTEDDDADMPRLRAYRVQTKDLSQVRKVVRSISAKTGSEADAWVKRTTAAFTSVVRPDGTLGQEEVGHALQKLSQIQDQGLLWQLGPLIFRLLDTERKGSVTLKDFLMGQAILFAAAKTGDGEKLGDYCWRALDLKNTGVVTKQEVSLVVSMMIHLGAVDPDDLRLIKAMAARAAMLKDKRGRGRQCSVQDQAVVYYMEMYDPEDSGRITREGFDKCSNLQDNFRRLLRNDQIMPMFLTHEIQSPTGIKL